MSRKNDEIIEEEEPLEVRVRDLKTKVIARLAVDLDEKNKEQHLDPFALIFLSGFFLYTTLSSKHDISPNLEFKSPIIYVGVSLKLDMKSWRLSMYSGVLYLEQDGGIYTAIQIMSTGRTLNITQSLNSSEITIASISEEMFLYTTTPPRGVSDSMGFDLPINKKSEGHLSRIFRCDSLITIRS